MSDNTEQPSGQNLLPSLRPILAKLPWFGDLAPRHREDMLDEVQDLMIAGTTRDIYAELLQRWADVAHGDLKWAKFELLRVSGMLAE